MEHLFICAWRGDPDRTHDLDWVANVALDQGKKDPWLRFHAWQAFFLGLASIILSMVTFGIAWVIIFVLQIIYAIKAYQGEYFEIPLIYGLAKGQALK